MATHFDTDTPLPDPPSLVGRLNGLLPPSIAALRIHAVRPDAHARFSATARTYIYAVTDVKDPFMPGGGAERRRGPSQWRPVRQGNHGNVTISF